MKKIPYNIIHFIFICFLIYACSKTDNASLSELQYSNELISANQNNYLGAIVQSPSGLYSDQEVINYVEELLNDQYADPHSSSGITYSASQLFDVEKQGGGVSQSALDEFYSQAVLFASNHFYCVCPDPNHQVPVVYDVELDSSNSNYLRLSVTSIVAIKQSQGGNGKRRFLDGEQFPSISGDFCNDGNTTPAYTKEAEYVNYNLRSPIYGYFKDIEAISTVELNGWFENNQNDPDPYDMIMDYVVWAVVCNRSNAPDPYLPFCPDLSQPYVEEYCLQSNELNFYLDNLESIMINNEPQGKSFIHVDMTTWNISLDNSIVSRTFWGAGVDKARYGTFVVDSAPDKLPKNYCN